MTQTNIPEETDATSSHPRQSPGYREQLLNRHAHTRTILLGLGGIVTFFTIVGLILHFQPGSGNEPSGEPALDVFAAGPFDIFEPGTVSYFTKEHFYLVRLADGAFLALYDLGPDAQARVSAGDEKALSCRAELRQDEEMAGWLAAAEGTPPAFPDHGIYDECHGVAWDMLGQQVWGPPSGQLDRFPVGHIEEIVRVNLGHRRCMNEVTSEAPCIQTQ